MKTGKRILSLLMVLVMIFSLCGESFGMLTAYAAEEAAEPVQEQILMEEPAAEGPAEEPTEEPAEEEFAEEELPMFAEEQENLHEETETGESAPEPVQGTYLRIDFSGEGQGNPRVESLDGLTAPEGTEILEAYSFADTEGFDYAVITVTALPAMNGGDSIAVYPLFYGELNEWPVMEHMILGDVLNLPLSWYDGFALVKVLGEAPALEEQIIEDLQPEPGVSLSLEGLMPEGASVELEEPAAPALLEKSLIGVGSPLLSYDFTILDENGDAFQPESGSPITVTVKSEDIADALEAGLGIIVLHTADYVLPTDPVELERFTVPAPEPVRVLSADGDTVVFEAESFSTYTVAASNSSTPESAIYVTDDFYLTGKLPGKNAIVDATPVTVEIDGERQLVAYDIKVYVNRRQKDKGRTWQPAPNKVQVHFYNEAFGDRELNVYHLENVGSSAELVTTATAQDSWIGFDAQSFSIYAATVELVKIVCAPDGAAYKITVSYDPVTAGIPDGAELSVDVIEDAGKLAEAAEAVDGSLNGISYGKLFNISIVKDDEEYQPNDKVTVKVELLDAEQLTDVKVVHFGEEPQPLDANTQGTTVTFETEGFSLFSFLDFSVFDKIITAVLGEREGTLYENDDIVISGKMPSTAVVEANRVDVQVEGRDAIVAYDIKIYAHPFMKALGIPWQPTAGAIQVTMKSDALNVARVDVWHIENADAEAELVGGNLAVEEGSVSFEAESFSVYVVVDHEGGAVVNPRVEFHFISSYFGNSYTDGTTAYYGVAPYAFKNKGKDDLYQTTQILKNGEGLELIPDPLNEDDKSFFGWYMVSPYAAAGTNAYGLNTAENKLYYTWPEAPSRIRFEQAIAIDESSAQIGDTVHWSLGSVSGSGTVDEDGNVHVLLAPVFERYHFVNFMQFARGAGAGSNASNLMTRKLLVLGSASSVEV